MEHDELAQVLLSEHADEVIAFHDEDRVSSGGGELFRGPFEVVIGAAAVGVSVHSTGDVGVRAILGEADREFISLKDAEHFAA